jgi:hypothetical protein
VADIESGPDAPGSDPGADDSGSVDAALAAIARHALHDEELIAAFAAGDVDDAADQARAEALLGRCATCRDLHRDLIGIRATIHASGTAEQRAATMAAPRDFRLSVDDAARLRPGTPIERLASKLGFRARLGLGIAAFGRPVGAAMATFGVVGLLVGSLTLNGGFLFAGSASAPSSAPGIDQTGPAPEATEDLGAFGPVATGSDATGGGETANRQLFEGRSLSVMLLGGSAALLVLGLILIVAARRKLAPAQER